MVTATKLGGDDADRVTASSSRSTDGVADVRLNRPEKRNALDGAMFAAIADAGERLKADAGGAGGRAVG